MDHPSATSRSDTPVNVTALVDRADAQRRDWHAASIGYATRTSPWLVTRTDEVIAALGA